MTGLLGPDDPLPTIPLRVLVALLTETHPGLPVVRLRSRTEADRWLADTLQRRRRDQDPLP